MHSVAAALELGHERKEKASEVRQEDRQSLDLLLEFEELQKAVLEFAGSAQNSVHPVAFLSDEHVAQQAVRDHWLA